MYSLGAFVLGLILVAAVLFLPPVAGLFSVVSLTAGQYISILLLALIPTAIIQLIKIIAERLAIK